MSTIPPKGAEMVNAGRQVVKNLVEIRHNPCKPVFTDKSVISEAASVTGLFVRPVPHTYEATDGLAN